MRKILSIIILSLLLLGCFSSCNNNTTPDSTDTTTPSQTDREVLSTIVDAGKASSVITMQSNGSAELFDLAVKVQDAVKSLTGVTLNIERDSGQASGMVEILVGHVKRPALQEVASELRGDEYAVKVLEKEIVLVGSNETGLMRAVNYFIRTFLTSANITKNDSGEASLTLSSKNNYIHKVNFLSDTFIIGDRPVTEFVIVHGSNALPSEIEAANAISEIISSIHGFRIPVVNDFAAPAECEILVGKSNRDQTDLFEISTDRLHYSSKVAGTKLMFYFSSVAIKDEALSAFESALKSKVSDKTISLKDGIITEYTAQDISKYALYSEAAMRIMSSNILFSEVSVPSRMENLAATYKLYLPDILCLQEARDNVTRSLYPQITDTYKFVEVNTGDNAENYTPILYLASKYEVVESGFYRFRRGGNPWSVTYAVFKSRSDGTIFAVCNTHFSTVKEDTPVLGPRYRMEDSNSLLNTVSTLREKYKSIPVFATGDFNANPADPVFKNTTSQGLNSAMFVATVSDMRLWNTYHSVLGSMPLTQSRAIDHVMASTDQIQVFVHKVVTDKIALEGSDHNPVYADISFVSK